LGGVGGGEVGKEVKHEVKSPISSLRRERHYNEREKCENWLTFGMALNQQQ